MERLKTRSMENVLQSGEMIETDIFYPGPVPGLQLILNVEGNIRKQTVFHHCHSLYILRLYFLADFYLQNGLSFQSDEFGISVTIDETRYLPNVVSDYIDMTPGNAYDVQLAVTETSRIEAPYTSKCRNDFMNQIYV